jgi:hypothetical protein
MTSKIKALSLALASIAAMSAIVASAAQAGSFDVGAQPAVVSGHAEQSQNHVFTLTRTATGTPFTTICSTSWVEATTQGTQNVQEATATATYGGQCLYGPTGLAATVRLNGCKYTVTGAGSGANTATVDITGCTNANGITIQIAGAACQLRIPAQNGLSHVVGSEPNPTTTPHTVTLNVAVSGITVHQSGPGCPDGDNHLGTNGYFQGNTILKATQHTGTEQVTEHGHQFLKNKLTGTQVNLTST